MEIHRLGSSLVLIVNFDEIPLAKLISQHNLDSIIKKYNFNEKKVETDAVGNPIITFSLGSFSNKSGEFLFKKLVIEERKLIINVEGPSSNADTIFSEIKLIFSELAGKSGEDYLKPIVRAVDSECVAQLNFHAEKLIAPDFLEFVKENVLDAATNELSVPKISPELIVFRIEYPLSNDELYDYRVTLSRKEFILSPRQGFPLEERMFASKAPVDTDTHLKLLEGIENIYSK